MNKINIIEDLTLEKENYVAIIASVNERLSMAPKGKVRVQKHGKGYQFYHKTGETDNNGLYIPAAERPKALALIQKGYDLKIKAAAEKQYLLLKRFLKGYEPERLKEIYESLNEAMRQYIIPAEISDDEYVREWLSIDYERKSFSEDMPEHYTGNGERVRSKSEVMIADALRQNGIPYRYECPIKLGKVMIYPDFSVLRKADRTVLYWEHLGMMDDPNYCCKALQKIRMYEKHGLYPGVHLILTMETSDYPINLSIIKNMIRIYCV